MTDSIIEESREQTYAGGISRTGFSLNVIELSGSLNDLSVILQSKIAANHEAYHGRAFVLDIAKIKLPELHTLDFPALQSLCRSFDIYLIGVCGVTDETRAQILTKKQVPIVNTNKYARVREENLKPKVIVKEVEVKVPYEVKVPVEVKVPYEVKVPVEVPVSMPLTVIARPVRSGETIQAAGTSAVIFGSIGSGARVVASHHIIVIGDIKGGEVYAGSPRDNEDPGFTEAFIYASGKFSPSIVSIAGNYQTAEDMESDPLIGPLQGHDVSVVVSLEGTSLHYWQANQFSPKKPRRL